MLLKDCCPKAFVANPATRLGTTTTAAAIHYTHYNTRHWHTGTRSIQLLYRAVLFTFVPTALELLFVCGVLGHTFSPLVGWLVMATFAAYFTWSVFMTQVGGWRGADCARSDCGVVLGVSCQSMTDWHLSGSLCWRML